MIAKSACKRTGRGNTAWLALSALLASAPAVAADPSFDADAVIEAFQASCDGYSSDELLIRDELRDSFLAALSKKTGSSMDARAERSALLQLLNLRKAGKLTAPATRRGIPADPAVMPVAEIASRVVTDRHRITTDTMLADPNFRQELQREAELISPGAQPYSIGKAVLSLRKKRALRPELVLRVADWERQLQTFSWQALRSSLQERKIPQRPGIYIFRIPSGYLYVGEAADLAARLSDHVADSDRKSLAEYLAGDQAEKVTVELHIFPADSPAAKAAVRRAYESELIRSRQPKFNVRP